MLSEKTKQLIAEYDQLMKAVRDKQAEIDKAIDAETNHKLSLCSFHKYPLHLYCGYGEAFNVVCEIADKDSFVETHKYDDGMANYTFTINGTEAIAIGPQRYLEENRDGN